MLINVSEIIVWIKLRECMVYKIADYFICLSLYASLTEIMNAVIIRDINRAMPPLFGVLWEFEIADKSCVHVRKHLATHVRSLLLFQVSIIYNHMRACK